jgi:poly-gamma-glutamate synthesis protein (capsule biosynthesis protein)
MDTLSTLKRRILICLLLFIPVGNNFAQADDPITIWISDKVPVDLLISVNTLFQSGEYVWTNDLTDADLTLDFQPKGGVVTTQWVYVPVVPFANTAETLRWEDVRAYWGGNLGALSYLTPDGTPPAFVTSNETYQAMVSLLGVPQESVPLRFVDATASIPQGLWDSRPYSWGIMGFNVLVPEVKALMLDRHNVFGDDFDPANYPLTAHIDLAGDPQKLGDAIEDLLKLASWQPSNRDPSKLARIVLTGVTALSRATAYQMEQNGITSPADGIIYFFQDADLLHTSNEVSFSENCGAPDPYGGVIFCSKEEYFQLLTHIGLDVVELTGNHNNDYGPGASRNSLDMYAAAGIGTYGGGYDPEDARDAYITEVKGNKIAFIGCNVPGPAGAWASETRSGAAPCDDIYLSEELPRLAAEVDIVIVGVQEFEYYRYTVGTEQLRRFEAYARLGADVVIGTQAHQPQGFTFSSGAFLHHGLGNLFFDQMEAIGTRQMFADKLIIYNGRLINVVLFTGLIENFCCPRPMTALERADFLNTIFQASGW